MRGSVRHLLKTRTSFANRSNEDMLGRISTVKCIQRLLLICFNQ